MPELLSFASQYRPILMGTLLILVTLFAPGGLAGLATRWLARHSAGRGRGPGGGEGGDAG